MKKSHLKQFIKEEIRNVLSEGLFNKFTQATIDDVNYELLRGQLDRNIELTDEEYGYEDSLTDYVYNFIMDFNQRTKQGVFGSNSLSKEIDSSRDVYKEVRNRFKENGNRITVREIGEIVASNYLIKK